MLVIGLTGGIGSGKTTVANLFAHYNIPVIDTDLISRQITKKGNIGYQAVVDSFGSDILDTDGEIDRNRLKTIVFQDETKRKKLELLLHPIIKQQTLVQIKIHGDSPYCIVVIPLLVEAGFQDIVNRVLVVDVPDKIQLQRVMRRDQLSGNEAEAIMNTQLSREARLDHADDVIVNDSNMENLSAKVSQLHHYYLELATAG